MGNVGQDPEHRVTQAGQSMLSIRLATSETYLDKDKVRRERTDWHTVIMWGKRADALSKIIQKGSRIFVEGSLRTRTYDDKAGVKKYAVEVIATDILFAGGRGSSDDSPAAGNADYASRPGPARTGSRGGGGPAPVAAPADAGGDQGGGYGGGEMDDIPF